MQYLLLIYETESLWQDRTPDEQKALFGEYMTYTAMLKERGALVGGDALEPVATATTVRIRDGEAVHTDGPFAETKEQLGGYYLIEAADLDEALAYAAQCPAARSGSIEVRPIMVY